MALPTQSTAYAWPNSAAAYDIEFFDVNAENNVVVKAGHRENHYTYEGSPVHPGLLLIYPVRPSGRAKPYTFPINDAPSMATLRWMVRASVNDVEVDELGSDHVYPNAPKWNDTEIDMYIREAIGLFNSYNQRDVRIETTRELLRSSILRGLSQITEVSYFAENLNEWITLTRFVRRGASGPSSYWEVIGGQLKLTGRFPENMRIEVVGQAPYPVPSNDLQTLTIDKEDWDILSLYAQGRCYLRLAGQSAQLDRWKEDGKRNDNPITPIARMLMQEADARMRDRRGPRFIRRYRA